MPARTHDDTRRFRRQGLRVLVDYSCDGGVHCDILPLESTVKLRFRLPNGGTLHEIEGRVCWANDLSKNGPQQAPGFGIAFASSEGSAALGRELEDLEV